MPGMVRQICSAARLAVAGSIPSSSIIASCAPLTAVQQWNTLLSPITHGDISLVVSSSFAHGHLQPVTGLRLVQVQVQLLVAYL